MTSGRMSVCVFSNLYPPLVSGSSVNSSALSLELARRGHRLFVITARVDSDTPEYEETDGVAVYRLPAIRLPRLPIALNFPWLSYTFTPGNLRRIDRIFRRRRPDVIHLHNHMFDLSLSAVWARRRFGIPLVITIHTMIRHTRRIYNLLLYPADRVLLRCLVAGNAHTLLCPDFNIIKYVREAFPTARRAFIPYGMDLPDDPAPDHVALLRKRHGLEGKRVILSLGHVHSLRDRRHLISALPAVRRAVPNVAALIVGAETTDAPRKLARELGVQDAVIFAGHAPHEDVPAYLALADLEMHLFVQGDVENTSPGIASMEAMSAGKATMTAANENTFGPGVLRNGRNVILVNPDRPEETASTIVDLLRDDAKRGRIGQAARQMVQENLSWDLVCRKTLEAYQNAIGETCREDPRRSHLSSPAREVDP